MFQNIRQGLFRYRDELIKYRRWLDKQKKHYGRNMPVGVLHKMFDWNTKLSGMEFALGLTKKEKLAVAKVAGLKYPEV